MTGPAWGALNLQPGYLYAHASAYRSPPGSYSMHFISLLYIFSSIGTLVSDSLSL